MSEKHEPTLGDVLAAVATLGGDLRAEMMDMRKVLMGRMDRLQDSMTKQRDDIGLLLDMAVANKERADLGLTEARAAVDLQGSNSSALLILQRKVLRLEDELRELRDGRSS